MGKLIHQFDKDTKLENFASFLEVWRREDGFTLIRLEKTDHGRLDCIQERHKTEWYNDHQNLRTLVQYLQYTGHTPNDILYALEKPYKYDNEFEHLKKCESWKEENVCSHTNEEIMQGA